MKFTLPTLRRTAIGLLLGLLAAAHAVHAAYPEKPIRWIVPAAAGGAADATTRIVATALSLRIGQPIVVDNRPGATGAIGLDAVAKALPDGYTLGSANLSNFIMASLVSRNLPYNAARDFAPIAMLLTQPCLLGVPASLPVKSVKELVAYAKAHPTALFYGSSGSGSSLHVATELFRSSAGIQATHVPYKSAPAAETDLMAGQLQMLIDNASTMAPNVESGRIRALAVTGPKRLRTLPNVPTMAEAGLPAAEMVAWAGVVGPTRMPADIVKLLNAGINAVLADPKVVKQLADLASDAVAMSADQFAEFIRSENARWSVVVKAGNITAD